MTNIYDSQGRKINLGKLIGKGGEGAVYEIELAGRRLVTKIYHEKISNEKQAKIIEMIRNGNESLKKISTWPLDTITKNGQINGFIMEKIDNSEPIHHYYSPAQRKQNFPDKDWAFLVNMARNVCVAFDIMHQHNYIIGDINPNLVFVASDSVVKLIDCDSFQIIAGKNKYLCEVGVPHFTPPELQVYTSFKGVSRTRNHDNFGLAILIFHLLMMGRHPYSGVFLGQGEMPLETSIEQFRYAFGSDSSLKKMTPPPNAVLPNIASEGISSLFERAFTEIGVQKGRPTANEWIIQLDALKRQLITCRKNKIHKYFNRLNQCPWCLQEEKTGKSFFIYLLDSFIQGDSFNLNQVWEKILNIQSPSAVQKIIYFPKKKIIPKDVPSSMKWKKRNIFLQKTFFAIIFSFLLFLSIVLFPKYIIIELIVGLFITSSVFENLNNTNLGNEELEFRKKLVDEAKDELSVAQKKWVNEASEIQFDIKLKELTLLKFEYENLEKELLKEKDVLLKNIRNAQLYNYLNKFYLDDHKISGIADIRKATLASFGIETAADINSRDIINIPGFGKHISGLLIAWRANIEHNFIFDSTKGINPQDLAALNQKFLQKRKKIEANLLAGPEELSQIKEKILSKRKYLLPIYEAAHNKVQQAIEDVQIISKFLA
jgi:DNA-binding helix-hairpin-helix protein with protein kinase domain